MNAHDGNSQYADEIRALLKETDQILKETARIQEETARWQKETSLQMKETDRRLEETALQMKETDRRLEKQFGNMGNRFGEVIEHLFAPGLQDKFLALGYKFDQINRDSKIRDSVTKQRIAEIDILLTDGKYDMAVEVKVKPDRKDVDEHIDRVKKIRAYYDNSGRDRKILGAVAGAVLARIFHTVSYRGCASGRSYKARAVRATQTY